MLRSILSFLLIAILTTVAYGFWLYNDLQKTLEIPLNLETGTVQLKVKSGDNMQLIADKLKEEKLYNHPDFLRYVARKKELDGRIHVGEYLIEEGMTPLDFLTMLSEGKVIQHRVTLVEGWNFRQFRQVLAKEEELQQTIPALSDEEVMEKLNKAGEHPEGRFFPDSYYFTSGSTDLEILERAYLAMEKVLAKEWENREKDLPYKSPYEALIMASIVEKETGKGEERARIAGVFVKRLNMGMKLQTDPTVIYGIGPSFDGDIRRKDLTTDTPYNTYTREGLPPSPIAMLGTASLHAALHPEVGDALYFVGKGDGTHYFSATLEEHNKAVAKYQLGQ